jgi:hypothetical protein
MISNIKLPQIQVNVYTAQEQAYLSSTNLDFQDQILMLIYSLFPHVTPFFVVCCFLS